MEDWDWELLNDSPQTPTYEHQQQEQEQEAEQNSTTFSSDVVDDDNNTGVFRSDYFSIDSHHHYVEDEDQDEDEGDSSDNPSWVDPSNSSLAGARGARIRSSGSNSDSSGPTSDTLHLIQSHHCDCDHALIIEGENPFSTCFNDEINTQENNLVEGKEAGEVDTGVGNERVVSKEESEANSGSNLEKKVVWWRVPLEVLRYCVLRVSPVWSLSMAAAAVMGFIIFRRRYLYKMKRKTQGLQLKVTVDDKKVSQFMSRVARLNEAFSVVKRVPMIRPSLPSPGLTPWPVMSMR